MQPLIDFLLSLVKKRWTGEIIIDIHEGKLMKVMERKKVNL